MRVLGIVAGCVLMVGCSSPGYLPPTSGQGVRHSDLVDPYYSSPEYQQRQAYEDGYYEGKAAAKRDAEWKEQHKY